MAPVHLVREAKRTALIGRLPFGSAKSGVLVLRHSCSTAHGQSFVAASSGAHSSVITPPTSDTGAECSTISTDVSGAGRARAAGGRARAAGAGGRARAE